MYVCYVCCLSSFGFVSFFFFSRMSSLPFSGSSSSSPCIGLLFSLAHLLLVLTESILKEDWRLIIVLHFSPHFFSLDILFLVLCVWCSCGSWMLLLSLSLSLFFPALPDKQTGMKEKGMQEWRVERAYIKKPSQRITKQIYPPQEERERTWSRNEREAGIMGHLNPKERCCSFILWWHIDPWLLLVLLSFSCFVLFLVLYRLISYSYVFSLSLSLFHHYHHRHLWSSIKKRMFFVLNLSFLPVVASSSHWLISHHQWHISINSNCNITKIWCNFCLFNLSTENEQIRVNCQLQQENNHCLSFDLMTNVDTKVAVILAN